MTKEIAAAIVDVHNKWRNQQALGQTPNYESSARMLTMKWDDELSKLAEINVRKCDFESDACINTRNDRKITFDLFFFFEPNIFPFNIIL